jgi:hypothetical protein
MRRGLTIALTLTALATWWPAQAGATTPPTAGAGTGWAVQPTPAPPASEFYDVFCLSATDCTAVGNYEPSSGPVLPLAEHWNGHTWAIQATPAPTGSAGSSLDAVSCTSSTNCTAVGNYQNSPLHYVVLAEHWNGRTWAIQAAPNPAGNYDDVLIGISCAAAASCVAVGQYVSTQQRTLTLAEHWNGSTWALTDAHDAPGNSSVLIGVSCTAVTRCVAIGDSYPRSADGTLTDVWNGSAWTLSRSDTAQEGTFYAISCTGADSCTAVGGASAGTLAAAWNGSTWAQQAMPHPARLASASLVGVSCLTAADCTAVGSYPTAGSQSASLAEHFAGGRWQVQVTPAPASGRLLESVSCTAAGCTAAGYQNSATAGPVGTLAERN